MIRQLGDLLGIERGPSYYFDSLVRSNLPKTEYVNYNGILVKERSILDPFIPHYLDINDKLDYKFGYISTHREYTSPNDDVVIIGGGKGVSGVVAAQRCMPNGSVTIFEGSQSQIPLIRSTIVANRMDKICDIENVVVEEDTDVLSNKDSIPTIPTEQLPDCDVLEMDCEGAELSILRNLEIFPKIIIVEHHPWKFNGESGAAFDELFDLGYQPTRLTTNNGGDFSKGSFRDYLSKIESVGGHGLARPVSTFIR